jgi:hypothetical protein
LKNRLRRKFPDSDATEGNKEATEGEGKFSLAKRSWCHAGLPDFSRCNIPQRGKYLKMDQKSTKIAIK